MTAAEPGAWFTYYYWLDDTRAPDFARLPDDPADGPVLLCSSPRAARTQCAATEVKDILLELSGL